VRQQYYKKPVVCKMKRTIDEFSDTDSSGQEEQELVRSVKKPAEDCHKRQWETRSSFV